MKYDRENVLSICKALGFKNVHPHGNSVVCSCPYANLHGLLGMHHKNGDKNPSFFIKPCSHDSTKTIWACSGCEEVVYPYHGGFSLEAFQKPFDVVMAPHSAMTTANFLYRLAHRYQEYGYPAKASMALSFALEVDDFDENPLECLPDPTEPQDPYAVELADYEKAEKNPPFNPWVLNLFKKIANYPDAINCIEERGASVQVAKILDMRFDEKSQMLVFPVRDREGTLYGLRGRSVAYNGLPSKFHGNQVLKHNVYKFMNKETGCVHPSNTNVYLNEDRLDFTKPVLIVEGIFDLLKAFEVYPNTAAIYNRTAVTARIQRMQGVHSLIWFTDLGTAESNRIEIEKRCDYLGITLHHVHVPEGLTFVNPLGKVEPVKDVGAMPHSILKPLILEAVEKALAEAKIT